MWWESCEKIHCGFWINLDNNRATQSTLTLPTQWGIILTAFLALFIRLAGSYLWGIICFAIHQSNASSEPQDDTYHQIQVALRNTDTEASLGWKLFRVGAVHQGSRINTFGRASWLIVLAMVHCRWYRCAWWSFFKIHCWRRRGSGSKGHVRLDGRGC
ncbi:hypothetical protein PMIN06_004734 [Paraphaeosphaeria minitans]